MNVCRRTRRKLLVGIIQRRIHRRAQHTILQALNIRDMAQSVMIQPSFCLQQPAHRILHLHQDYQETTIRNS